MNVIRLKGPQVEGTHSLDVPAPTIMATGIGAVFISQHWLDDDGRGEQRRDATMNKPAYAPLTMARVNETPLTPLTHVSTFSGGGGTCLGFRLAGFRTLWANDVDAHARRCYRANLTTPIDGRDIRFVTAAHILAATGLAVGELDVFEGSPPCTAFSTAGKRAKGWGQRKEHADYVQSNVEDLFFEWLRILEDLQPRAFVAENVTGLIRGVAKGYFKTILAKMKAIGYETEAQLLDAQWLGVPQQRQRIIFVGIRKDLQRRPQFPVPLPYRYSVRDALPWLTAARYDTRGQFRGKPEFVDDPCPTLIGSSQPGRNAVHYLVTDAPASVCIEGNSNAPHERKGRQHSIDDPMPTLIARRSDLELVQHGSFPRKWQTSDHPSPPVMAGRVTNIATTADRTSDDQPTGRRRKFTIAEVKRLCSFPDDYVMSGSYGDQWARLGNSVPPLMAYAIAEQLRQVLTVPEHGEEK